MPRRQYPPDQIIQKLREAEVLLSQGQTVKQVTKAPRSVSRPTAAGEKSMGAWIRPRAAG